MELYVRSKIYAPFSSFKTQIRGMRGAPTLFIQLGIRVCNDNSSDQLSLWFKIGLVQVTSLQSNSQNIKGRYY